MWMPDCLCHTSGTQTMSLCLLEFWVPLHKVSGTSALCMRHVFEAKLYFTKDIVNDSFVPKGKNPKPVSQSAPKPAPMPAPMPAPKPAPKASISSSSR